MNIVLLVCDALRYDHVTPELMPHLCNFMKVGVCFDMCFSIGGTTLQSMPGIFCSSKEYSKTKNIASILSSNGYKTGMVHSNPLLKKFQYGFMERETTYNEGLKVFIRQALKKVGVWRWTRGLRRRASPKKVHTMPYRRAEKLLRECEIWIASQESPWFLWTQLMDPHIPYIPPEYDEIPIVEQRALNDKILDQLHREAVISLEEREKIKRLYRAEIKYMDECLGRFLYSLVKNYPKTLTIITSDHGDEFGEYRFYSHAPGKHGLIPQLCHIPLIFLGLGFEPRHYTCYVSHLNIAPTILDYAGVKENLGYGRSLKPLIEGKARDSLGDPYLEELLN